MGFLSGIGKIFKKVFDVLKRIVNAIVKAIIALVNWVINAIVSVFSHLGWLGVIILVIIIVLLYIFYPPFGAWLHSVYMAMAGWVYGAGLFGEYLLLVWDFFSAAWAYISPFIGMIWDAVKAAGSAIYKGASAVWDVAKSTVGAIGSFVGPLVSSLLGFVGDHPVAALLGVGLLSGKLKKMLPYLIGGAAAYVGYKVITKPGPQLVIQQQPRSQGETYAT